MNHHVESLNGWMTSRWSSSNSNTNFNNTSKHFTQSEPSSPGEVSMSWGLSFPNPNNNTQNFGAVNSASSSSSRQQYLPFNHVTTTTKDSLLNNNKTTAPRKDIYENSSVTDVEGQSTLSTDFSDSYSTFLKLDVEDFIQSCIGQSHSQHAFSQSLPNYYTCPFKQYAQIIPSETATIPQEEETNPKSPSTRSLPPKISKNTPSRKTHSSSSSSLDSLLVPEKRKRNKRNCLPGETKMIMWKWNKATIKEAAFAADNKYFRFEEYVSDCQFPVVAVKDKFGEKFVVCDNGLTIKRFAGGSISSIVAGYNKTGFEGEGTVATLTSFNSIQDIAFHPITNELYIADTNNNMIRKVSNGSVVTVAGIGNSTNKFNIGIDVNSTATMYYIGQPSGLAFDFEGNLYFTEKETSLLRRMNVDGTLSIVAGRPFVTGNNGYLSFANETLFNHPTSIAITQNGSDLFIADTGNGLVRMLNINDEVISTFSFQYQPYRLSLTLDNNLLMVSYQYGIALISTRGRSEITMSGFSIPTSILHDGGDSFYLCTVRLFRSTFTCPETYVPDESDNRCYRYCDGIKETNATVCNGRGSCGYNNNCYCNQGYFGHFCENQCKAENSGRTPYIYSNFNYNNDVTFQIYFYEQHGEASLYVGDSSFDPTTCSIIGNQSLSLSRNYIYQDCGSYYSSAPTSFDELMSNPKVSKTYTYDYLILTVPISLHALDKYGINNNGICNAYSYYTTQTIYVRLTTSVIVEFQADPFEKNVEISSVLKLYPQSFFADSDGILNMGLVLETINSTLDEINFYYSSNPSYSAAVTATNYLYTRSNSKFYQVSAESLNSVTDYRSNLTFSVNMTDEISGNPINGFVTIKITYTLINTPNLLNITTLQTSATINDNNWQPKSTFNRNDRVFIQLSTTTSVPNLYLRVKNAYMCCFKQGFYASSCSTYNPSTMDIWKQIITNGAVDQLEPILYPYPNIRTLYGYSFKLLSNAIPSQSVTRNCYIESNLVLTNINARFERNDLSSQESDYSSIIFSDFKIENELEVVNKSSTVSKSSINQSSILQVLLLAFVISLTIVNI